MPLHPLPHRHVSDAENKLRVLCCVNALGGVTEAQLWPFVAALELMEYIPMQLFLHELIADGDVEHGVHALSEQLFVTEQGYKTLQLLPYYMMESDLQRILAQAPAYRMDIAQRSQVRALYETAQPGHFCILLSVQDGELPTLSIRLHTAKRNLAEKVIQRFPKQAPAVLAYLYSMDSPVVPEDAGVTGATAPHITQHSVHEYTVTVAFPFEQDTDGLTLSLLLPGQTQAEAYREMLAMPSVAAACVQKLLFLLAEAP